MRWYAPLPHLTLEIKNESFPKDEDDVYARWGRWEGEGARKAKHRSKRGRLKYTVE